MVLADPSARQKRVGRWLQIAVHVGSLFPLALLVWDFFWDRLTANWVREITLRTGRYALVLLVLSLACTPLYVLFRFRPAQRMRRPLGLYAFLYAGLHLLVFVGLDYGFDFGLIAGEISQKRFIQVGLIAFLILLALAATSTKGWMKRLGKNWKRLHRLVYLAALLVVVHLIRAAKADIRVPLLLGALIGILLIARIPRTR